MYNDCGDLFQFNFFFFSLVFRLMIFYCQNDLALIANDGKTLKRIWAEIGVLPPLE